MFSKTEIKEVARVFGKDFEVASSPDFPHLLSAPDIWVGGNGRLYGLFLPKSHELIRPERLLLRLAISRLGLPGNMLCVLVVRQEIFKYVDQIQISENFDVQLSLKHLA
ncbi:hypothetical protein ACFLV0_04105 [Chloroflexota bacterium]